MAYDRYNKFTMNGNSLIVPFIEIDKKDTDLYVYYKVGKTRLDLLSYQYYNDANYDWLILQANPQYGALEYKIPDGARLRIPYPLSTTLTKYNDGIDEYEKLNGLTE